jgi:hypothetical protein
MDSFKKGENEKIIQLGEKKRKQKLTKKKNKK